MKGDLTPAIRESSSPELSKMGMSVFPDTFNVYPYVFEVLILFCVMLDMSKCIYKKKGKERLPSCHSRTYF